MKFRFSIPVALLCSAVSVVAFDETFDQAQAAYDEGRYAEASILYENLLSNNVRNIEVEYNLANACFKNGELPQAVLHYRKAWYSAPRDPDIRANMNFALSAAGTIEPAAELTGKFFNMLSKNEWVMAAIGSYILFTLLMVLGMLIRPAKRMLAKLSLLPAALILISAGGWWHWHQLRTNPEWIVVKSGTTALFGPMTGSTAHYSIPLASIVRQQSTDSKGWVEIEYDGKKGWVEQQYIQRVSP
jgi:tetratricopeptide (TPR) repeat protein